MRLVVVEDLIGEAARMFEQMLRVALEENTRASMALSGGSTPWPILARLAEAELDWGRVDIYQVDERVAPIGHGDRNLSGLTASFLPLVPAVVHPMPVEDIDLDEAAARYAASLPDPLDIVHLGLGHDGHTASLVPGDPVLDIKDRDVAMTERYFGRRRMTLTYRAIDRARSIVWLVTGEAKREALERLLAGDSVIPAASVSTENATIITDLVPGPSA